MSQLLEFQFNLQVQQASSHYKVNSRTGGANPYSVNVAWGMYRNACSAPFLVFGRTNIDRAGNKRLGGAIEDIELWNLGATNDDLGTQGDVLPASFSGGGAILRYQKNTWHELYNHAWLLGGVHGRREFHCASPRAKGLVESPSGKPSMWGHELLFLDYFGYRPIKTAMEEIWVPTEGATEKSLGDFIAYFKAKNVKSGAASMIDLAAKPVQASVADRARWDQSIPRV